MTTLLGFMSVWLLVMGILSALTWWIVSGLKRRYPERKKLWWAAEMFVPALAVAPIAVSAGYIGFVLPAALGLLNFFMSPEQRTPKDEVVLAQCVLSILVTWVILWGLRAAVSWLMQRKRE